MMIHIRVVIQNAGFKKGTAPNRNQRVQGCFYLENNSFLYLLEYLTDIKFVGDFYTKFKFAGV